MIKEIKNKRKRRVIIMRKLFAIQDSEGGYVDENTIWYERETGIWHYSSQNDYRGAVWLSGTIEEANQKINILKSNLHNIKDSHVQNYKFMIKEIV